MKPILALLFLAAVAVAGSVLRRRSVRGATAKRQEQEDMARPDTQAPLARRVSPRPGDARSTVSIVRADHVRLLRFTPRS